MDYHQFLQHYSGDLREILTWKDVLLDESLLDDFLTWEIENYDFLVLSVHRQMMRDKLEADKKLLASGVPIDQIQPPARWK